MSTFLRDLGYAVRSFRRTPGFTAMALITLALGIGANVAIFTVLSAVVLRPLPYPEPNRIVQLSAGYPYTAMQVVAITEQAVELEALSASAGASLTLTGDGTPEEIGGTVVGPHHFDVFGVSPSLGRSFVVDDSAPGTEPVALLSHELWVRRYGEDRSVVGRTIQLAGEGATSRTVVGVMPPGYRPLPWSAQVLVPMKLEPGTHDYEDMARFWLLGRLAVGASVASANAELESVTARLTRGEGAVFAEGRETEASVSLLQETLTLSVRRSLWLLFGAVGAVLLIACTNVANLLLARAGARNREIGIRLAMGAGRGRLMRQLLTESGGLALAGGLIGVLVAQFSIRPLTTLLPPGFPRVETIGIDRSVLFFALAASLLSGLLFGLAPALRSSRGFGSAIREGLQRSTVGRRSMRLTKSLVIAEIGLAVALVVCAGLLVKSFWRTSQVDPGFSVERVYSLRLAPSAARYGEEQQRRDYYRQVTERVALVPGVEAVGAINIIPLTRGVMGVGISPDGAPVPDSQQPKSVSYRVTTPGYIEALQIPILEGRALTQADRQEALPVGLINQQLAGEMWPQESAIGKQLVWNTGEPWFTVVGVVADVRQRSLTEKTEGEVYVPYEQDTWLRSMVLLVRSSGNGDILPSIRQAVWSVDRDVPISREATMESVLGQSMSTPRFYATLFVLFAGLALVLGAVGIYGLMSYTVSQRTREFGVRMALGASASDIVRSSMLSGLAVTAAGVVVGLGLALGASRLLATLLFEVEAFDPAVYVSIAILLAGVAAIASWAPARRAARLDPIAVLRAD